ncbi:shadow of prion protein 2 [Cebidichthys violaceus]|uniref:shadow of prion protein 2 n=1 Tax=Cebidichthys violaceus TaxID=271503 RepID=UPI0035CAC461
MKLQSLSVLCLTLLLFHSSLAKRGGGFGKGFGSKKYPTSNRGSTNSNRNNAGSSSQGGYPKQPGQPNQGGYPPQSGRPGNPGGGYPNQYPARGSPYGGGYGGYGGHGGYGGGFINQNPNNKVLSPHYGGSFGYGGHGAGGGSPFSHSVQAMGMRPSDRSRGFGRGAVMAAAGGAMAGMALGYGLGRFPRPPFSFHNPQEEHYYNHYMYRRYGAKSTDANDYSRDYRYSQPPRTYDSYMDSCMKRTDLLPAGNPKPNNDPAAATTTTTTAVASGPDAGSGSNTTETNGTAADNSSTAAPWPPRPLNRPADPEPPASQVVGGAEDDDDDTVSIVEIGYPALIEQVKARRCMELYMVYSERYLKGPTDGAQRPETGRLGLVAAVTSTTLMLLNSNMLMSLH